MANIFDYIEWRGDLSLNQSSFNEIDNLILSTLSYFPFEEIMEENETVSIKELGERLENKIIRKDKFILKPDKDLFKLMSKSRRFGGMKVTRYVNKIDLEEEKQFAAITILMPDGTIYISYRGTDNTIVGWKEDFNMSFKSHLPSQLDAVLYLQTIAKDYRRVPIRLGGHSKGGNLAVYAAAFVDKKIRKRIINVYNNDGPGFDDDIISTKQYKTIIERVHTYIPQDSICGRLLNHEEKYSVIKSSAKGIMQHDPYSWEVLANRFIHLKEVTNGSEFIDKTIKEWLKQTNPEQREQLVDIVFEIINMTKAKTFVEIKNNWQANAKILLKSYQNIDAESKEMILKMITDLLRIARDNLFEGHQKNN